MNEKLLFRKLRELGDDLPEEFALFPPLVLDRISADWAIRGGNDLLVYYTKSGEASGTKAIDNRQPRPLE